MRDPLINARARNALRRLARPGAVLRQEAGGRFAVGLGADARRRALARLSAAEGRALLSEGLVAPAEEGWRISAAGAAFLARGEERPGPAPERTQNPPQIALRRLRALAAPDGAPWFEIAELQAAERYQADWRLGALGPRLVSDWSAPPMGRQRRAAPQNALGPDAAIDARARLAAIRGALGAAMDGVLSEILGEEAGLEAVERKHGWPPRSAKVALKLALSRLAEMRREAA